MSTTTAPATSAPQSREALSEGIQIRSYKIQRILGQGGFGITYLAEHTTLKRRVALKELMPVFCATRDVSGIVTPRTGMAEDMTYATDRFMAEARQLALFRHPNIVDVQDIFAANGTAFMVMGYEDGTNLQQHLDKNPRMKESELREMLNPLLDALEVIHGKNVIHRDLKPANIYLRSNGQPMLLDFGAARQFSSSRDSTKNLTAIITRGYGPLEQHYTGGDQGPWTDIYAMGGVIHRIITGEEPPDAMLERTRRDVPDPYRPVSQRLKGRWSDSLLRGVDAALNLEIKDRPQTVEAWRAMMEFPPMQTALGSYVRHSSATVPPPTESQAGKSMEYRLVGAGLDIRFDASDFDAEGGELVIGRSSTLSQFTMNDPSISRAHVHLRQRADAVLEVKDVGSGNGTLINGKEIAANIWHPLHAGDSIELGTVKLRCQAIDSRIQAPFSQPVEAKPRAPAYDSRLETMMPPPLPAPPPPTSPPAPSTLPASTTLIVFAWLFALLGGWLGIYLGWRVRNGTTQSQQPNGTTLLIPRDEASRTHGTIIMCAAIMMMIIYIIIANS